MFRPNTDETPLRWRWVWLLVAVALVLRLGWGLTRPADLAALPDQVEYLQLAKSLLAGDGLVFEDPRFADTVRAFRMPGYPAFIAACGGSVTAVRIVQAVIDTGTVLAAVLLARRLVGGRWPLLAGALVAVNPFLVYFSALLLTETLFTAMLAWSMVLLAGTWRGRWTWWAGIGLLVLAVYVRPSGILLPILLGGWATTLHLRHPFVPGSRFPLTPIWTCTLLLILALVPWAVRNRVMVGAWVFTTTNTGLTLYDGLNGDADGSSDQSVLLHMPQLRRMDEVQRSRYLADRAKAFAAEHPDRVAALALAKVRRTWSPVPLSDQFGRPAYRVVAAAYAIPLFVLGLLGVLGSSLRRREIAFLLLPAVYFTLGHALTVGSLRYRVPAEVPITVLAAAGAAASVRSLTGSDRQPDLASADVSGP